MGNAKKEIGCCGHGIRILFLILNIFFVLIGLGLVAGGIYLVVVGDTYSFITNNTYAAGAPILIVCGVVTLIIAIVGLIAAIGLWWPLLLIYSVVLGVVVILEIVAAILGFVFQTQLGDYYAEVFNRTIHEFQINETTDAISFVNSVQEEFECCGVFEPSDWLTTSYYMETGGFPDSCLCTNGTSGCTVVEGASVYSQGCDGSFFEFVRSNAAAIGGIGLAFGLCEILGVVFGIILCCCLFSKRNSDDWTV
uniref:Tetraspanin n=1 Tax=Amphimedon queenslandica TaxID=400682 RepID=A0A1X7UKJ2_AMPQE